MSKRRKKRKLNKQFIEVVSLLFIISILAIMIVLNFPKLFKTYNTPLASPLEKLPLNQYDKTKFIGDNIKTYEDEKYTSRLGVDLSQWQKEVDFEKIKAEGISFVYLRCGYRTTSDGEMHVDKNFEKFYEEAKKAGLDVGVYFFSQAIDPKEAMDEAYFVYDLIKFKDIDLNVAYDLEDVSFATSRMAHIDDETRTKNAMSFCAKIEELGFKPMIYTNLSFATSYYDFHDILNYPIWYAQYYHEPWFEYDFKIWQYSESGKIDGVKGNVDMNIMLVEK